MQLSQKQVDAWRKARDFARQGKRQEAAQAFHKVLLLAPDHPHLLYEAGRAAIAVSDIPAAAKRLQKAARLAGQDAKLLCSLGRALMHIRKADEARACFERSIQSDGSGIDAIHELVTSYERTGQKQKARECLDPYLQQFPNDPIARYLDAFLLQRSGHLAEAETILQQLVDGPPFKTRVYLSCFYLLADILDKTERYDEAMSQSLRVKEMVLRNPDFETALNHYDAGVAQRKLLLDQFTPELIRGWQSRDPFHPDDRKVAFLGGHPRSGTTLLERVLDSHPDLTAFDEPEAFYRAVEPFLRRFGPDHPDLSKVTTDYRKLLLLETGGQCDSRVWLDKNPSLTACLHSWLRTFPGLKVVIALRHPMDVMLSCFFLDSTMNALSANFLSLERISKHYRDMMDVWLRLRDLGEFSWIESRYEDTVSHLADEGKRVTEFLGLDWQADQASFYQRKQQTEVVAPTYHDVTKPVHQRSMQRWLRYEKHLAPHLELLTPYMERLGYA